MFSESEEHRSWTMSRIKATNTVPEIVVRQLVRNLGYGYRLHAKDLPGKPDLVFRGRKKAIFVHGCFWHRHPDPACKLARLPKSNLEFWETKLTKNFERDQRNEAELRDKGWKVLTVWECRIRDRSTLTKELADFLLEGNA